MAEEWQKRSKDERVEVARLTEMLHQSTFGLSEQSHKDLKGLARSDNLRDHLSLPELTLLAFVEGIANTLHEERGSLGLAELLKDVTEAGKGAGEARRIMEKALGHPVTNLSNFLKQDEPPGEERE